MSHDTILIVDFGSQVTQLIARRVREAGVFSVIAPFSEAAAAFREHQPAGVIFSGGPGSTHAEGSPRAPQEIVDADVPILGICYGQMTMTTQMGGRAEADDHREFGRAEIEVVGKSPLIEGIWSPGESHTVWMSHGDRVVEPAPGFEVIARSPGAPFALIANEERRAYGLMFHPEVVHTPDGARLIENFVRRIAGATGDWTMAAFREEAVARIRAQVGDGKVICGLSGGVDSTVTAVLIAEAIGDQLTCIFVDHGLLRQNEAAEVEAMFAGRNDVVFNKVDASDAFLSELAGVTDPEQKRKVIGRVFVEVFEKEAKAVGGDFLAQGTLYPDVIESVSATGGPSVTIKSHHNVGGLPERMGLKLVEPLRLLFKDEVRALGRELGLGETFVGRHPFPGPGLAIRCPGEITGEGLDILRRADAIYIEEIRAAGLYDKIWQAFAVLLPVKTVGVMGDARTYEHVLALRAVTSTDGMTADVYPFDPMFLSRVASRIVNQVRGVNRVVYDVTSKPPGTIEWE
ncbi:glutamine-hydrolyzing GMP synthase [Acuticoccus sp. MNP-M23]|uniref:glutamine-hydrolyzing GMP synthase n=1 Tax=Acuticoccus sp. MNP-M23 TaxID=3072793 RepID=UPI0028161EFE|nr:glutamine-hydrolyzing GMP synthase [Acuticoccus sp. MNP-M23]WMS42430.1 glutamine-hydrolyzing GMP synthase [Acuticoccus sp. MNP-M23]